MHSPITTQRFGKSPIVLSQEPFADFIVIAQLVWIRDLSFSQTSWQIEITCEPSSRIDSTSIFPSNFTGIVQSLTVSCAIKRSGRDKVPYSKATAGISSSISLRVLVDVVLGVLILLVMMLSFRYQQISGEIAYNSC